MNLSDTLENSETGLYWYKLSGSAWLSLSASGHVIGTPALADAGEADFFAAVRRADEESGVYGHFKFRVSSGQQALAPASVLWVVDNSNSMEDKRRLAEIHLARFRSVLDARNVDYRIAVTTTDFFNDQGQLMRGVEGEPVITPRSGAPGLKAIWKAITPSAFSFWPQGLEASYAALDRHGREFLQDEGPIAVIYLSHYDDYSCLEHCVGREPWNNPDWVAFPIKRYSTFLKGKFPYRKVVIYPIVSSPGDSCVVPAQGHRYLRLKDQVGGSAYSICGDRLEESMLAVARSIADQVR